MMDFYWRLWIFVPKMMDFLLKMMDLSAEDDGVYRHPLGLREERSDLAKLCGYIVA